MKDIITDPIEQPRDGVCYFEFASFPETCFAGSESSVVFNTKEYNLECRKGYQQYQGIAFEKGTISRVSIPKDTKTKKHQKTTHGVFDDYYARNYWRLQRSFLEDADYVVDVSEDRIFAAACKELDYIALYVFYWDGDPRVELYTSRRPTNYKSVFKDGKQVDESVFRQIFNLTLELMYDPEIANREVFNYWEQLRMLCDGDEPVRGITINADYYFNDLRKKVSSRIKHIEKRLIDEDGPAEERAALRGEIKGLKYALRAIDGAR